MLVGYFFDFGEGKEEYFSDDFVLFYKDKDKKEVVSKEELTNWAVWLNSPWSYETEEYTICFNCEKYNEPGKGDKRYKCEYHVTGYDGIESLLIGYGKDEISALNDCLEKMKYLQDNYNLEKVSI